MSELTTTFTMSFLAPRFVSASTTGRTSDRIRNEPSGRRENSSLPYRWRSTFRISSGRSGKQTLSVPLEQLYLFDANDSPFAPRRRNSLFSKFTLSSDGFNHIRIKSASLVGADSTVDIQTARDVSSPATVSRFSPSLSFEAESDASARPPSSCQNVSPRMPASFLFRLLLKEDAAKGLEHDPLRLTVIYRTVADGESRFVLLSFPESLELIFFAFFIFTELRETIRNLLHPLIESSDLLDQESWLLKTVVDSIQSVDGWETRFLVSGLLEIPEVEDLDLQRVVKGLGLGEKVEGALQVAWRKAVEVSLFSSPFLYPFFLGATSDGPVSLFQVVDEYEAPFSGPDLPWRTLEIPVDVPLREVSSSRRSIIPSVLTITDSLNFCLYLRL